MNNSRRQFMATSALAALGSGMAFGQKEEGTDVVIPDGKIKLSLKIGMCGFGGKDPLEKFKIVKKLGYDGIELNSPGGLNKAECRKAADSIGLPIHGVVDSIHWRKCFSDPSEEVRAAAIKGLEQCVKDTQTIGGSSILIVPGKVGKGVTHQQVWDRSIECVKKVLPQAAAAKVHILIENVWNGFLYDPKGGANQTAELLRDYVDAFDSPWVGSYFDIGNHQRFGKPEQWIKTLGKRIVKLDAKDWGVKSGFSKIGEGDVNWKAVRQSLLDIDYSGWATAEVKGGSEQRCAEVLANMKKNVLGEI